VVFNINTGKEEKSIYVDDFMLNPSMALSPDGSRMITASGFNVKIWDTQKWREVRTLQGPGYALSSIAYSFDGSLIAAGSYIKAIRIWDSKGNELKTFTVPNNPFSISFSPDNKNLAVAFMDSTLRIYDIETTEEICRFISFDNNEWLCITPDGYYNASPKGDEYINIRFDDEVYGIYQFSRAFYRPEVLKARLQGLPDPDIVKQFGDIMIDNAPPGVTVEVSNEEEATQTGIANLQVSVVDEFKKYPIDHIEIVVNGRLVGADELESVKGENLKTTETRIIPIGKRDSLDFSVSIKLDEGPNDIEIIVANEANYGLDTINLKNNSGNTQNKPDLWLLSIGINDYTNFPANGWNDLNGAAGDAQRIVTSFTEQQGKRYNKVHTLLVADGAEIKTTKSSIMESMEFFKQADPEDVSLLFIAAHGETVNGVYYFIPSDISFDSEGQLEMINAIDTNDIIKSMDIPGRKIILIDTCQSGGVDNNKLIRTLKNRSTVIFSAAQENEYAAENVDFGGGYFTYSILEGINGKASTDDEVLIKQLGDFVNQNVTDIGNQRRYRNKQHPLILIPDGYKDFIIAQIP
jgi:hypothetical protein